MARAAGSVGRRVAGVLSLGALTVACTLPEGGGFDAQEAMCQSAARGQTTAAASDVEAAVAIFGAAAGGHGSFLCSGVVVGETHILTARHCLDDREDWDVVVFFGEDAADPTAADAIDVVEVDMHPTADLAVLTLAEATDVSPLGWADATESASAGSAFTAVGYGAPPGSSDRCLRAETGASLKSGGASGDLEMQLEDETLCQGDSGGPLLSEGSGERILLGVLATALLADGEECSAEVTFTPLRKDDDWVVQRLGAPTS